MKSPGIIYRRYRQLKKKFLYEKVIEAKLKKHSNCFYGNSVEYPDKNGYTKEVQLCMLEPYRKNLDEISVCTCSQECNAFLNKRDKEIVVIEFEKVIQDSRTKAELYPELDLLEWVLDKDKTDAIKNPNLIGKFLLKAMDVLEYLLGTYGKRGTNSIQNESINN